MYCYTINDCSCAFAGISARAIGTKTLKFPLMPTWGKHNFRGVIRISEDCAGLGTGTASLAYVCSRQAFPITVIPGFHSESERALRTWLRFTHDAVIYKDVVSRARRNAIEPMSYDAVQDDIYTAGFPCQPYAGLGLHKGRSDKRGKSISDAVCSHIEVRQPKVFILENVKGLIQGKHKAFFEKIIARLKKTGCTTLNGLCNKALTVSVTSLGLAFT